MMKMSKNSPAERFGEAFPLGNGQLGAVVYGSFPLEKITLTENTFFSGKRGEEDDRPGAAEAFRRMRELTVQGKFREAHEEAEKFIGRRGSYGTNLPVGELRIRIGDGSSVTEYGRSLDFGCGVAESHGQLDGVPLRAEAFASHPDHVLVWHLESGEPVELTVEFLPYGGNGSVSAWEHGFLFSAKALERIHCDEPCGVSLYGACRVLANGERSAVPGGVRLSGVREVTLCIACGTDYAERMGDSSEKMWMSSAPETGAVDNSAADRKERLLREAELRLAAAAGKGYASLLSRHRADVSEKMSRVELAVEGGEQAAELFQYGRYLLLSASREDSQLPAHLQGIWNDDVACRIGWSCDMHLDINTQMNYWIADTAGLSECFAPVNRWMERLAEAGERTARESYGRKGWAAELVSNAWCFAAPYWAVPLSPCPTGGAWLLTQLWDHYLFTEDESCLRECVYPLLRGAAEFFSDYVFEDRATGRLASGPSISPENSFLVDGEAYFLSLSPTYEITVIREIFQEFLGAWENLNQEEDRELAKRVWQLLFRLPPFRILEDGTLAEWSHDYPAADTQHRHTSHLLGLYPFRQITPEDTPELSDAARRSLIRKLTPYENWEDTGWARSLLILYGARLLDGEMAGFHVKSMIENLLEPNGLIYHPPTRGTLCGDNFGHVYELDGNTGLAAGITEMLLQSTPGSIRLLPAVPREWKKGHVKGLRARGGITVEFSWENGKITEYSLTADREQEVSLRWGEQETRVALKPGTAYRGT